MACCTISMALTHTAVHFSLGKRLRYSRSTGFSVPSTTSCSGLLSFTPHRTYTSHITPSIHTNSLVQASDSIPRAINTHMCMVYQHTMQHKPFLKRLQGDMLGDMEMTTQIVPTRTQYVQENRGLYKPLHTVQRGAARTRAVVDGVLGGALSRRSDSIDECSLRAASSSGCSGGW